MLNYELNLPQNLRIHPVFYAGLLVPYKEGHYPGRRKNHRPDPEIVGEDEEFEIEEILDIRYEHKSKQYQYLIKWVGYPPEENTWQPLKDLTNSAETIEAYHKENPGALKPPRLEEWLRRNL